MEGYNLNINKVGLANNIDSKADKNNKAQSNPSFKGIMDIPGVAMNAIEKGGFATSFIIQDTLGMTVPRTGEGLQRGIDKDRVKSTWNVIKAKLTFREPSEEDKQKCLKFKDLNFKEGAEVGIREGLSGPFMMFTPMLVLFAGKKFMGKSTFTNSSMIKRLGNKLSETVRGGASESVAEIKNKFYRKNVLDIVKSTTNVQNEKVESAFVDKAVESLEKIDSYDARIASATGKLKKSLKKEQKEETAKLIKAFNDYHKTNSADLGMLNRVKYDGEVYSTEKMVNGMRAYAHDAFHGKQAGEITEGYTDNLKKTSMVKRGIVNLAAALSTIGSLSIVPMLYKLVNPVPPGALGDPTKEGVGVNGAVPANADKSMTAAQKPQQNQNKDGQVSFTGKWDKLAKHMEFNGNQMTPALMTSLAVGGLMGPRVKTAVDRAPENPVTKKKDYSEIPEILTRDIVSTGAVTFGVPMLSKVIISSYEDKSGFVLQSKPDKPMSMFKKVLDKMNPFSAYNYYGISDLDQIYGNIDTTEKLGNMSKFVDSNNGNLAKVLKTAKKTKSVFTEAGLDLDALAKQSDKKAANQTIIENLKNNEFAQKVVNAIKPEKGDNSILKRARTLNSVVSFAATALLVPAFLGIVLPKMVYKMTENRQKRNAALAAQAAEMNNTKPAETQETAKVVSMPPDYSKLRPAAQNKTFQAMRHSA